MEIYLIRHTTPKVAKGICYGQTDLEVKASCFEQELDFINHHIPKDIEQYFSSPLQRCTQLAEKLNTHYKVDERLMELNFGTWENKSWNEIDQTQLNEWMQDFVNIRIPNGENYLDLHARTMSFIKDLLKSGYKKIAIITHAGNMRSFISFILSLPLENSFRIRLEYGAVVSAVLNENEMYGQLISINNCKSK